MVLSVSPSKRPALAGYVVDLALLAAASLAVLVCLILWLDNAQGGLTGNGIFKSIELKPWIVDPARAPLYPSNYFFYPAYGALCRLLDSVGVMAGDPRRQLTLLNAASATLCLCVVYLLVRRLTGDRVVALMAAAFHIACNYVLLLAITNEDIMPSYTVLFASMALASLWFARPTAGRVVAVSILFSVGWLFEWRLMFPTLPAMLAALWLCEARMSRRLLWIALFLAGMLGTATVVAWLWRGHEGAVGPFGLLWTGKAVVSAWAGFSWDKVGYLSDGLAGYLLGAAITRFDGLPGWDLWRYAALAALVGVLALNAPALWRGRNDPRTRALVAVFGGTFVAGEVFNLYSQPQDPQMQLNVVAWLTVGWALLLAAARAHRNRRRVTAMAGLTAALFAYNVWSMAPQRGGDTAWRQAFATIDREADPSRTVFLVHVFDWMVVYASLQDGPQTLGTDTLGPAPQVLPKYKWIGFAQGALRHPERSDAEQVADLEQQIDRAFALGYQVLVVRLWRTDERQLEKETGMIASSARISALRTMLHRDYSATPAFDDPVLGPIDRLQKVR